MPIPSTVESRLRKPAVLTAECVGVETGRAAEHAAAWAGRALRRRGCGGSPRARL